MNDFPRFMIRGCGQTIEPKIHTCQFDDENENSSVSSLRGPPNASSRSTPLSRTPFTSNATSCHAPSSRSFGPRRLRSGSRAASQPDLWREPLQPTAPVNVSMPSDQPQVTGANCNIVEKGFCSIGTICSDSAQISFPSLFTTRLGILSKPLARLGDGQCAASAIGELCH